METYNTYNGRLRSGSSARMRKYTQLVWVVGG